MQEEKFSWQSKSEMGIIHYENPSYYYVSVVKQRRYRFLNIS